MTNANPKDGNGRQQAKKEKPVQREDAVEQEQAQPEVSFANMQMVQQAIANPEDANRNDIKGVQRTMGNRFVQQMSRNHRPKINIPIQPKLEVNEINDPFEQEAESVADALPMQTSSVGSGSAGDGENHQPESTVEAVAPTVAEPINLAPASAEPEEEIERSEELASAEPIVDAVPPVDGADSGGDGGDNPADNGDNGSNNIGRDVDTAAGNAAPNDGGDLAQTVVRTHVPTQLSGALFNPAMKDGLNRAAEPAVEEPEQIEELGGLDRSAVPPIGNPDEDPSDAGDDEISLSADAVARDAAGAGFGGEDRAVHDPVENTIDRKRGGGEKLDKNVQGQMEGHLGSDFSDVRVHTDGESDQLNRSLNAKAFTTGNDVFFSKGAYEPGSHSGQKLIAHELTHVVQQGGAVQKKPARRSQSAKNKRPKAQPTQRLNRNSNRALYRSTAEAMDIVQRMPAGSRSMVTPLISRAVSDQMIQRRSSEKEKAKKKAQKGKNMASEKGSDADSAEGRAGKNSGEIEVRPAQQPITKKLPDQKLEPVETIPQVNPDDLEPFYSDMDTGGMGWSDVQPDMFPDWDSEITKYDAFNKGDFGALGVDLSGLEGDTAGITVDDPAIREQMVADALNGINTPDSGRFGENVALMGGMMPYAGDDLAAEKIFTEGPGQWWNDTKAQFGNDFADVKDGFGDLFGSDTGSGWARMAGMLNIMIGLLSIVRRVVQIIRMVTDVFYWIIKLFVALSKVPFIGAAFRWARPIAERIMPFFSPMGAIIFQIDHMTAFFRSLAAAFLAIDMMYYETDPEKLMERQAQLKRHVAGMQGATANGVKRGVSQKNKDERAAEEGMIGAEDLDDPRISPFTIEHTADAEPGTKQDYKDKFLAQYGVPDVADQVADQLLSTRDGLPPPPLREYGAGQDEDIRYKLDRNAIAIMELEKQKLGIKTTKQEAGEMVEVAQHEQQVFAQSQESVAQNKEAIKPHTADMDHRMDMQGKMKSKTGETGGISASAMAGGNKYQMLTSVIIKFVSGFMSVMQKVGVSTPANSKGNMKEGSGKANQAGAASDQASKKGQKQADERKVQTMEAKSGAKKSEGDLDDLNSELQGYKDEAQEGEEALTGEIDEMDEAIDTIETEEDRLIEERTEAINDAVNWMSEWRSARMEIFEQVESDLDKRYKDAGTKDEDAEEESDIHDEDKDMESDGMYFTDEFEDSDDDFDMDW